MRPTGRTTAGGYCDKLLVLREGCVQQALASFADDAARGHAAARRVFRVKVPRLVVSMVPSRDVVEAG